MSPTSYQWIVNDEHPRAAKDYCGALPVTVGLRGIVFKGEPPISDQLPWGSYILYKAVLTAKLAVRSRRYEFDLADLPRRRQGP